MSKFMGKGLGPNDPETADGKQTKIDFAFDLMCPQAMLALARVLQEGRERGRTEAGWKSLPTADHLNHALMHIFAHQIGDRQEDHLQHAFCRLMMAWSVENTVTAEEGSFADVKWVYLCYPFKDNPVRRTNEILHWAANHFDPNIHFFIPHSSMAYMREEEQRSSIMIRCLAAVAKCHALWIPESDAGITDGMRMEIDEAHRLNIPVLEK